MKETEWRTPDIHFQGVGGKRQPVLEGQSWPGATSPCRQPRNAAFCWRGDQGDPAPPRGFARVDAVNLGSAEFAPDPWRFSGE